MDLNEKVYKKLREVPAGRVTTYKLLSEAVGTNAYRAVGQILSRNPFAPEVPCHRVVKSSGEIGGFKGEKEGKGILEKVALLSSEGVEVGNGRIRDFQKVVYRF